MMKLSIECDTCKATNNIAGHKVVFEPPGFDVYLTESRKDCVVIECNGCNERIYIKYDDSV